MNETKGSLIFQISTGSGAFPISDAVIILTSQKTDEYRMIKTDGTGKTEAIKLSAPPKELSLEPSATDKPYGEYNAQISADGYITVMIYGVEVFPGVTSIEEVDMQPRPNAKGKFLNKYTVLGNALEMSKKEMNSTENTEKIINTSVPPMNSKIYIPQDITVHLGAPSDVNASNVTVPFIYYLNNVASGEIYPTWPDSALRANLLAQASFVLNRVFTRWYRDKGYPFDITNNTAYDQYFVPGRAIYENISRLIDELFTNYLVIGNSTEPFLAIYCNGYTTSCKGLSKWGSVAVSNKEYNTRQILREYYGDNIEVDSTDFIENVDGMYPGEILMTGSKSPEVKTLQRKLNRIRANYKSIPVLSVIDGIFGDETKAAVIEFQKIFNLDPDGVVGKMTWDRIALVYSAINKFSELNTQPIKIQNDIPDAYLSLGSTGDSVLELQNLLRIISGYYSSIPYILNDGIFNSETQKAVMAFQKYFGITADGVVGKETWSALYNVFLGIAAAQGVNIEYPGYALKVGSEGNNVWLMQSYLNKIGESLDLPIPKADGIFGLRTETAVKEFQKSQDLTPDGIIGKATWNRIVSQRLVV